jgi:hypothetical protein
MGPCSHAQGEEPIGIVLAGVAEARSKNPQAQLRAHRHRALRLS